METLSLKKISFYSRLLGYLPKINLLVVFAILVRSLVFTSIGVGKVLMKINLQVNKNVLLTLRHGPSVRFDIQQWSSPHGAVQFHLDLNSTTFLIRVTWTIKATLKQCLRTNSWRGATSNKETFCANNEELERMKIVPTWISSHSFYIKGRRSIFIFHLNDTLRTCLHKQKYINKV